jgi:predicted glycogen debranching enzyme
VPSRDLDRATFAELTCAEAREWIVTNGLGGFASGTVAGTRTRRYHGLLFAARRPPVGRTLLCPAIDVAVDYDGARYPLATERWKSGAIAPYGVAHLTGFRLEGTVPVWTYTCGDALLEQRIWMEQDANRTYVTLLAMRARRPLRLALQAFANHRDLHGAMHAGDWRMEVAADDAGLTVVPFAGAATIAFRCDRATFASRHVWYRDFAYPAERARGLDDAEDHLLVGEAEATLAEGEALTIAVADAPIPPLDGEGALRRRRARDETLLARAGEGEPGWVDRLVLAADQFVVRRPLADDPEALSVIAGYPWFGDWGRDTAIALPGLALATGRPEVARAILTTFARFVDGGMLPNFFADGGERAEYNTVDAALWYVEAVRRYVDATDDLTALRALFPTLRAIVEAYTAGTRFGIGVDANDGLLRAGVPGVQLTWMDAKVGDWVVTPRIGKPIEVNALWIAALRTSERFARTLDADSLPFAIAATHAEASFERFWNAEAGWCYDVLDGPDGDDPALRPNQLFAVALPIDVLDAERRRAIVDVCASRLWTPAGLRSLDPAHPAFRGRYGGSPAERDGAYHQGSVWIWLAGPFALAHLRAYGDPSCAREFLAEVAEGSLTAAAFGSLPEIAEGDAPFAARGATAQAWSVAAILDAWRATNVRTPTAARAESGYRR